MHKPIIHLSLKEARRITLKANALHQRAPFNSGKNAVFNAIKHLGYIQLDTISVVNRAHHHVLWSRVPGYKASHLDQLQFRDKKVLEFWSHAAAYLPMEDYRFTLWRKAFFKDKKDRWPKPDPTLMKKILDHVKQEGPTMARDFEDKGHQGGGWWEWKPAKWALERLFLEGDLVIIQRKGFQKIYDLPERVIPHEVSKNFPSPEEYASYLIKGCLNAFGLATVSEIIYQRRGVKQAVINRLKEMIESGEVSEINIKGLEKETYYSLSSLFEDQRIRVNRIVRILSPFDNFVIQRKRILKLFDFDYQIECYVPKPKRKYGYFSLPVLFGDQFLGRVDAKADRKTKVLHLFNLVFESGIKTNKIPFELVKEAFWNFAVFNQCEKIQLHKTNIRACLNDF